MSARESAMSATLSHRQVECQVLSGVFDKHQYEYDYRADGRAQTQADYRAAKKLPKPEEEPVSRTLRG
jgi:hypothetical protein